MKKNNTKKEKSIMIQMDNIPNLLKLPGQEEATKKIMRQGLERDLNKRISRYKELPPFIIKLKGKNDDYVNLLHEARQLYVEGKFYSCVVMCGVASERIAKDILEGIIFIKKLNKGRPDKFFNQLDRVQMDVVRELIIASGVVDNPMRKSFTGLACLRDKYVHARSLGIQKDAQKAIKYLHEIIEGTVSVFKKYKIQKGKLIPK